MPSLQLVLFIFSALGAGLALGYIIIKQKYSAYASPESVRELEQSIWTMEQQCETFRQQNQHLESSLEQSGNIREQLIRSEEERRYLNEKLTTQKQELEKLYGQMTERFELLAGQTLERNAETFGKSQQERLSLLLNPLKEKIADFEKKVEETHRQQFGETKGLKEELRRMEALNLQMRDDARHLTEALKGDQRTQGHWGEMVLEKILERSGLTESLEFHRQKALNVSGAVSVSQRPDIIVDLPGHRQIIIDSKVSLKAYESCLNTEDEAERKKHFKAHLDSIRNHVKGLSEKHYYQLQKVNSLEFVLLFIPVEASYSLAFRQDHTDLFSYAWERKIIVVSPTTLMATLRTIASLWKTEKQHANALRIAEEGGKLYDKLYAFIKDLEKVGRHLDQTTGAYDDAMKKLHEGRGNLLDRAEKLKDMGVTAKKSLGD
ncbi:DNA recombination protein RmuC [Roseivirga sp. BDSF3-8]|uniref:DNA recombination protein RmuC n=1 Tax=Roseivirga sp. BDSF3-8 TaxID=3241598 RepID=UPI0035321017